MRNRCMSAIASYLLCLGGAQAEDYGQSEYPKIYDGEYINLILKAWDSIDKGVLGRSKIEHHGIAVFKLENGYNIVFNSYNDSPLYIRRDQFRYLLVNCQFINLDYRCTILEYNKWS